MFNRRKKSSLGRKLSDFFWPSIGFRRSSRYVGYRLARLPGTPYSLAAGFAFGAAVSVTPFVGVHFILAGLLSWLFRANLLASALGTLVGNPWTFPFIWTATYKLGHWFLDRGMPRRAGFDASIMDQFLHGLLDKGWESVAGLFTGVLMPMTLGALPIAILVWMVFFYPLRGLIMKFHAKRAESLLAGRERQTLARKLLKTGNITKPREQ